MNILEALGTLALATRLKLLGESLSKDVAAVYAKQDIPFEPRWFTLFWALQQKQSLTITELARELRQTHSAIVQVCNQLEKQGYLRSYKDKNDERRRQVSLSPQGMALFEAVAPVLDAIQLANNQLLHETAPDFLQQLSAVEQALDQKSMYLRILQHIEPAKPPISIKPCTAAQHKELQKLYKEWMLEYTSAIGEEKPAAGGKPAKGDIVFCAFHGSTLAGAVTLKAAGEGSFQISQVVVSKGHRNRGIGKALFEASRGYALAKGASRLHLFTSPLLPETLNFFIKLGFYAIAISEEEQKQLQQPLLKMQLELRS